MKRIMKTADSGDGNKDKTSSGYRDGDDDGGGGGELCGGVRQ